MKIDKGVKITSLPPLSASTCPAFMPGLFEFVSNEWQKTAERYELLRSFKAEGIQSSILPQKTSAIRKRQTHEKRLNCGCQRA